MPHPRKRRVAATCGDGHIRLVEQEVPALKAGMLLVEVRASLISPGTELRGWHGFAALRRDPDTAAKPKPFGYSNSGVVLACGDGVDDFKPGDRIAAIGGGYAMHADYAVIPHNLCVKLPAAVTFEQGSYAMLTATALHALRRGRPELGDFAGVAGLGLVGQLAARLYQLAGCYVMGWDTLERRLEIARGWGIDATARVGSEDEVAATRSWSGGAGLDDAVLAFGGNADSAMTSLLKSMKVSPDGHPVGIIVVVGGASFAYTSPLTNIDIRRASRTGPGYHDGAWEVGGPYPPVFMRWTTRTNLELCMRLIAEKKLPVDSLTTHRVALARIDEETSAALENPDGILGMVILAGS
jgi:threonine dehydrogenase-like Zn-dependent dehydrogenase